MTVRAQLRKRFRESATAQQMLESSKRIHLPGFKGLSIYEVWPAFLRQLRKTSLVERASGVSFNVVMALPPLLLFIFTLVPLLPISQQFVDELFKLIRDVIPGQKNNSVIIAFLADFLNRPRTGLLSFGLLLAIFFSSNALVGILRAFDKNYPGFISRRGWRRRLVALQLTLILLVLVFICISLLIAQGRVLQWLGVESRFWLGVIHVSRWVLLLGLIFTMVAILYRQGPSLIIRWPLVTPGSVFATTLMVIATAIVTFWVNHFSNYNKLYGSISAILILMSLIYVNALAILMGFELNVTLSTLQEKNRQGQAEKTGG